MSGLIDNLAARLSQPLPGRAAQARFEPELAFGRHAGPAPASARRAAVTALVYFDAGEWKLPLIVRPDQMTHHGGQVSLPGGLVEPEETSQQAALRELEEELGVPTRDVRLIGRLTELYVFVTNYLVEPHVATIDHRPVMVHNPREVAEVVELPLAALADPALRTVHHRRQGPLLFSAPAIRCGRHAIWGATAMILGELAAVVYD